jgi:hypothetical protein
MPFGKGGDLTDRDSTDHLWVLNEGECTLANRMEK